MANLPRVSILPLALLSLTSSPAHATTYEQLRLELRQQRSALRSRGGDAALRARLLRDFDRLSTRWLGTAWGLGAPQIKRPGKGKINCGTFVGRLLADMGFRLRVWKWQQQPSYLAIRTVTPGGRRWRRWFPRVSMKRFIEGMRAMGDGLYIVGLDFHVGFLRQEGSKLTFIHASYISRKVEAEAAASSRALIDSRSKVVGKLLSGKMLRMWRRNALIKAIPWHRAGAYRRGVKRRIHFGKRSECSRCKAAKALAPRSAKTR